MKTAEQVMEGYPDSGYSEIENAYEHHEVLEMMKEYAREVIFKIKTCNQ